MNQFTNELSLEIYEHTYKYGDETLEDTQKRVAENIASVEKDKDFWTDKFISILEDFKFVPGGRIISNAGTKIRGTTYINCFTSDANVLTKYGYKKISDIEIGDEVLTHLGRFRKVVSTMEKFHSGKINVYSSSNLTSDIKVTLEHPFYQGKNEWEISEKNEKLALFNFNEKIERNNDYELIDLYDYVKDIKRNGKSKNSIIKDDKYLYTVTEFVDENGCRVTKKGEPIKRFIYINDDFAYFIGRFIGNGSIFNVNNSYDVDSFNLVFNNKEKKSLNRIKNILSNNLDILMNENNSNFDGFCLEKNSPLFSYFLMKTCGRYSSTKTVPKYIWSSNKNVKMSFLLGLFDADGTITNKDIRIILNNEKLIFDVQSLLLQVGIPSTKKSVYFNFQNPNIKEYPNNVYYQLSLTTLYSKEFIELLNKEYDDDRTSDFLIRNVSEENTEQFSYSVREEENDIDGKIFFINKFNKTEEELSDFVYNISVEQDESYVVNNVIVHNCFVDGFVGKNQDSISGILEALRRQAFILKSEGGYGFCADVMRPRGGYIEGIANDTPGSVKWLDNWNTQSDVITAGSGRKSENKKAKQKIRKGAQMVTLSCWHPDIEEYITAKQTTGKLDKFNMSVLITDDFMDAVINNKKWDLIFPDFDKVKEIYNENWDGNIKKWIADEHPVKIYKTFNNANELWNLIMTSTYCVDGETVIPVYINDEYKLLTIENIHESIQNNKIIECLSINKKTLNLERKKILKSYYTGEKETINIKTRYSEFKITPEHTLFTGENGIIEEKLARNFKVGDNIISVDKIRIEQENKNPIDKLNNSCLSYDRIISIENNNIKKVYDLTIEDNENFIDSYGGLYHNCRNEPGVLFVDTMNKMNNLSYMEYISATNPCVVGETLVFTNIGWIKIKNLNKFKNIKIITIDKDRKFFESELKWSGITKKKDDIYKVIFSNGEFILTNGKHKLYRPDFTEISIENMYETKEKCEIIGGKERLNILDIVKTDIKEDVYDLTADPNYNFFTILNRKEIINKDKILINDKVEINYFSVVNTLNGQKFGYQLEEGDDIL